MISLKIVRSPQSQLVNNVYKLMRDNFEEVVYTERLGYSE